MKTKAMAALGVILVGNEGLPLSRDFLAGIFFSSHQNDQQQRNLCVAGVFFMPRNKKKGVPILMTL